AAVDTGFFNHRAAPLTTVTGALDGEETLGMAHTARTAAGAADDRLRSRFCSGAGAGFAGDVGRQIELRGLAVKRLFQGNFEIVAKICAAFAGGAAPARTGHAENAFEDIREGTAEIRTETMCVAAAAVEGGVAEAVIGRALLFVLEDVVSFVDFPELL